MTREEAIRCLSVHSSTNGSGLCTDKQHYEAKQVAIKALEQEPKFIAKSDGTIEQIKNCDDCLFKKEWEKIGKLISVVLEKQDDAEYHGTEDMDGLYYCPICQQTTTVVKDGKCPKCGATMDELSTRAQQTEDAISRQAAIDTLCEGITCYDCSFNKWGNNDMGCLLRERIRNMSSVNPQPETGWISVSERLPEEYGEYLITWTTSQSKRPFIGISEGEVTSEYDHEHNRFKFEWLLEDYVKNYPDVKVIAWMPLPEPYKAESEEQA